MLFQNGNIPAGICPGLFVSSSDPYLKAGVYSWGSLLRYRCVIATLKDRDQPCNDLLFFFALIHESEEWNENLLALNGLRSGGAFFTEPPDSNGVSLRKCYCAIGLLESSLIPCEPTNGSELNCFKDGISVNAMGIMTIKGRFHFFWLFLRGQEHVLSYFIWECKAPWHQPC